MIRSNTSSSADFSQFSVYWTDGQAVINGDPFVINIDHINHNNILTFICEVSSYLFIRYSITFRITTANGESQTFTLTDIGIDNTYTTIKRSTGIIVTPDESILISVIGYEVKQGY